MANTPPKTTGSAATPVPAKGHMLSLLDTRCLDHGLFQNCLDSKCALAFELSKADVADGVFHPATDFAP